MYVAVLDLGTTGCRNFIFDLTSTIIASSSLFFSPSSTLTIISAF